jgi:hypothetical protein
MATDTVKDWAVYWREYVLPDRAAAFESTLKDDAIISRGAIIGIFQYIRQHLLSVDRVHHHSSRLGLEYSLCALYW